MIENILHLFAGFGLGVAFTNWWLFSHLDENRLIELATENTMRSEE